MNPDRKGFLFLPTKRVEWEKKNARGVKVMLYGSTIDFNMGQLVTSENYHVKRGKKLVIWPLG